jgi:hypothetical protein
MTGRGQFHLVRFVSLLKVRTQQVDLHSYRRCEIWSEFKYLLFRSSHALFTKMWVIICNTKRKFTLDCSFLLHGEVFLHGCSWTSMLPVTTQPVSLLLL